jgi:hypothetical protein
MRSILSVAVAVVILFTMFMVGFVTGFAEPPPQATQVNISDNIVLQNMSVVPAVYVVDQLLVTVPDNNPGAEQQVVFQLVPIFEGLVKNSDKMMTAFANLIVERYRATQGAPQVLRC